MKSFTYLVLILLLSLLQLSSCRDKNNEDLDRPVVISISLNDLTTGITAPAGQQLHFDGNFKDNEGLSQYKIDIHDDFDSHGHSKKAQNFTPFTLQKTFTISGKELAVHEHIDVPDNATAGPYHFIVRLIDESGNESEPAELEFLVLNNGQPEVSVTSHDINTMLNVFRGDTLALTGTITDDNHISEILIRFENDDIVLYDEDWDFPGESGNTSWSFSELGNDGKFIVIPSTAATGHYEMLIWIEDNDGNITVKHVGVHVN